MLSRATLSLVLGGAVFAVALTLLLGGAAPLTGMASAQVSNSTNVTLSVETETSISVFPALFNFSGMTLEETNFSDRSDLVLEIENTGSTNLTNIYAHPNTLQSEQNNPLGTGSAKQYAAGRFLWIKNDSSKMYHASSLSWNMTEGWPNGLSGTETNAVSVGYYRNATGNYLWEMVNGTTSGCADSDASLEIKNAADTGDNRDLDTDRQTHTVQVSGTDWGVVTDGSGGPVTAGPLDGHYIALHQSCDKFYAYRFTDRDSVFPDVTGANDAAQYLVGPDGTSEIAPGDTHNARVGAAVPGGIPAGDTNRTLLTIYAISGG